MNRLPSVLSTVLLAAVASAQSSLLASQAVQAAAPSSSAGPPRYVVQEIARSAWGLAIPNDINDLGAVAGELDSGTTFGEPRHAVVWENGKTVDLTPGAEITLATAQGINNQGMVAGWFVTNGSYPSGGFRWQDGVFDVLPTFAPGQQRGWGVSERGLVLGEAMNTQFQIDATMWDPSLNEIDLGSLGQESGIAYDANGWDVVAGGTGLPDGGTGAVLWKDGSAQVIGKLSGLTTVATAINNRNAVVGFAGYGFGYRAFYWSKAAGMVDLGNLGYFPEALANDINDAGVIVGYSYGAGGRTAVVWHGGRLYDLESLLIDGEGWDLTEARGINELGQIVGFGRRDGDPVAYLLTPVGEPMTTVVGPFPGRAGATNTVEVVGATPGAEVVLLYGAAVGDSALEGYPGVAVNVAAPSRSMVRADQTGRATASIQLPAGLSGTKLFLQGVDLSNLDVTNLVVRALD